VEQDEAARLPTYSRHDQIIGELELKDTKSIVSVIVEVCLPTLPPFLYPVSSVAEIDGVGISS